MTTPHTPPAALDVAAIEARAAAARPDPSRIVVVNGVPSIGIVEAAFVTAALDDIPTLLAALRTLTAQHAADVAAAVAGEREACALACDVVFGRLEELIDEGGGAVDLSADDAGYYTTHDLDESDCEAAQIGAHLCMDAVRARADAIAAPTGGGE